MTLIVLEGIDRSGRSTHAALLEAHLQGHGIGVVRSSLGGSLVAGPAIRRARSERALGAAAMALLYAADIAERLELVIAPALRAGLVVVADRWTFTPLVRAVVRGVDRGWIGDVLAFAPEPDVVLWLDVPTETSLGRRDRDPHPYEAGLDLGLSADLVESYRLYQDRLTAEFGRLAELHGFVRIDADGPPGVVEPRLERAVDRYVAGRSLTAGAAR